MRTSERDLAVNICRFIQSKGYTAYFAGGCVRDELLGVTPKDFDIASDIPENILKEHYQTFDGNNEKYGITCVNLDGCRFEIARFRKDGFYSDGRRPDSVEVGTPMEDAERRDFTINGIFFDPIKEKYFDYVGGMHDLKYSILRCIGNPENRFFEDHLRIMRMVRFASKYDLIIDIPTKRTAMNMAYTLKSISGERIREELIRILNDRRTAGIELLKETNILFHILPEVERYIGCEQPPDFHPEGDVWNHTIAMLKRRIKVNKLFPLAVLLHDVGKPVVRTFEDGRFRFIEHDVVGADIARNIMERLKFSNDDIEYVEFLVKHHMRIKNFYEMKKSKRIRLMREKYFKDLVELHRLDCISTLRTTDQCDRMLIDYNELPDEIIREKDFCFLTGNDLIDLGLTPGPLFKTILTEIEDKQLEGEILSRETAIEYAKRYIVS